MALVLVRCHLSASLHTTAAVVDHLGQVNRVRPSLEPCQFQNYRPVPIEVAVVAAAELAAIVVTEFGSADLPAPFGK